MYRYKLCDLGSSISLMPPHRRIMKTKKDKKHNKNSSARFDSG